MPDKTKTIKKKKHLRERGFTLDVVCLGKKGLVAGVGRLLISSAIGKGVGPEYKTSKPDLVVLFL